MVAPTKNREVHLLNSETDNQGEQYLADEECITEAIPVQPTNPGGIPIQSAKHQEVNPNSIDYQTYIMNDWNTELKMAYQINLHTYYNEDGTYDGTVEDITDDYDDKPVISKKQEKTSEVYLKVVTALTSSVPGLVYPKGKNPSKTHEENED
ncbi:hypothetical protein DFH28DRAFT_922320 [Melampsora americana]|nr:hypothetical protein DFH28DRAFT_922320 [Melampsora americana]